MLVLLLVSVILVCCCQVLVAVEAPRIEMNDGNKIPIIALGTYGSAQDVQRMRQTVTWAVEAGYRHIDTASIYKNEEQIGQGIKDVVNKGLVKRENLFITTKLWNDRHDREQVVPALKESLANLDLDYVDLYLIHSPNATYEDGTPANVDYLETWRGMEEAKALGLTKSIGVSNFNVEQVNRVFANSKVKPAVNQIEVHPSLTQEPLVSHNQKLGVVVMAYSPFGFLVNRDNIADAPPPKVDDPTLLKMASKYGKTTGQIVLRYLIDRGTIPIPKSTNKNRLQQNIDILDFELTPEEIHTINKFNMNRGVFN